MSEVVRTLEAALSNIQKGPASQFKFPSPPDSPARSEESSSEFTKPLLKKGQVGSSPLSRQA